MIKTVTWLATLAWLLVASFALAAPAKSKGIVLIVEGADVDYVRRELGESIPQGTQVQDGNEFTAALASQGVRGSLADALANPKTRKPTLASVRKALKQVGAAGALSARAKKVGKAGAREIRVVLVVRGQAEPMVEENIALAKGERAPAQLTPLLSVPLQDLNSAPPPADEPEDKPGKTAKKDDADDTTPSAETSVSSTDRDVVQKKRGPVNANNAMVVVEAGPELGYRRMEYNQPLFGGLRAYLAPAVAMGAVGLQLYPLASSGTPVAKDIGLVARYSTALAFESKTKDGTHTATGSWSRYAVGVRGRILAGDKPDAPQVGLEGTYGDWKFTFTGDDPVVYDVPAVDYHYLRGGLDARIPFGPAALLASAGYLHVLSSGDFGDKFPHASIAGVDVKVGGSYALTPMLELRGTATYTRIFSTLNPVPGDVWVAGGALDQYVVGDVAVAALF